MAQGLRTVSSEHLLRPFHQEKDGAGSSLAHRKVADIHRYLVDSFPQGLCAIVDLLSVDSHDQVFLERQVLDNEGVGVVEEEVGLAGRLDVDHFEEKAVLLALKTVTVRIGLEPHVTGAGAPILIDGSVVAKIGA